MKGRELLGLIALHGGALALAGWIGFGQPVWLFAAIPSVVAGAVLHGVRRPAAAAASGVLLFGLVAALAAERHVDRLAEAWPERSLDWESEIQSRLADALDDLLRRGEEASAALAERWEEGDVPGPPEVPGGLRGPGVDALAVFGPSGELLAWEGRHQGPFPDAARFGRSRYLYHEGALFGHLYVTHPLAEGGGTAVAVSLLRMDLPPALDAREEDFQSRFEARTGARIDVARADRAVGESVWDLRWEDEILFSVTLTPASEADARAQREVGWFRVVGGLLLLGWFLTVVGSRGRPAALGIGAATLPPILLFLPLGRLAGRTEPFSPADFLLPGPLALGLGHVLALAGAGILVAGLLPWDRVGRLPRLLVVTAAGLLAAGVLHLLGLGVSRDFLAGSEGGWIVFQGVAVAGVFLPFAAALLLSGPVAERAGLRLPAVVAGLVLGVLLGVGWLVLIHRVPVPPLGLALLWVVPLWILSRGIAPGAGWAGRAVGWTGGCVLAVTLVLPWAWGERVAARMAVAEERVERLGTRPDPFLEFLLLRAGDEAAALAEAGRDPVEILYRAWTGSGLAWEGVPLWITYWSPTGVAREELRIGVSGARPAVPLELFGEAEDRRETTIRRFDLADAHYVGVVPLPDEARMSVVIPPRRILAGDSPLGPLFSPARGEPDPLVLIPLLPGERPGGTEEVRWIPTRDGWQGELYLAYPDEIYHAHYILELPGWVLLAARGTLLLLLNLAVLGVLWALGRWIAEGRSLPLRNGLSVLGSFRGRVTLALFAFFLIPSVLFGALAYRTLAGAAVRTAEALAERAVEDAASWYYEVDGAMDVLAGQVGSDLLLYENGELVGGSMRELVELGLYQGWLPPAIHRDMARGEELMTTATASLGDWDYVVAYRRMPGGRVLAAPAPMQAGATALRQRDVADLLAFSVAAGGILSVLLALLVGRALSRPIQTLRVASERVGSGNMEVRLPGDRADEFGAVFDAFNRMVDRLARTRQALLRSSRRTRAIVEEVATGVVALDPEARVTLVNPGAEELLGAAVKPGQRLPGGEDPKDPRGALVWWVDGYFRDGLREADTEISFGDRRIRVRARRIARRGPLGGAVLSLEDVTDELRSERILAWGEMAQQVAHEVKNPLTPIKLGVQHIRRAWEDGRPDFEEILRRNVDAILGEIERLATIAASFSRYAAPSPAGAEPVEAVGLSEVVREVLDLYAAGEGPVSFRYLGDEDLPLVRSRTAELKEVLVNLLENARAALPEGGEVRVEAEGRDGEVELRVRDDGVGIPPDLLPRIFEPHFSTRSSGTGLGLAIVRRLVESWGGRIEAESRPEEGTVVRIRLRPWTGGPARAPAPARGGGGGALPDS